MSWVSKHTRWNRIECIDLMSWVSKDTYNVDFWMSNAWLIGSACGLDLISQNQRCNALSTCGINDSRLHLVSRTLPSSTMPFNLFLCFFHVEIVDWLKLNCLHRSMALTPESNLFNISIFSFSVRSVCCLLGFDIVMQKEEKQTRYIYGKSKCIYFSCHECRKMKELRVERNERNTLINLFLMFLMELLSWVSKDTRKPS